METISETDLQAKEIYSLLTSPGFKYVIAILNKHIAMEQLWVEKLTAKPISDLNREILNDHISKLVHLSFLRDNFEDELKSLVDETDLKFTVVSSVQNKLTVVRRNIWKTLKRLLSRPQK